MSDTTQSIAALQFAGYFRRWQEIEDAKQELADQSKDLFSDMKGEGYDGKITRAVFRDKRKELTQDTAEREEREAIYDLYWTALESGLSKPSAHPAPAHEKTLKNSLPSPPEANTTGEGVSSPASPVTVSVLHSPEVAGGRPYPSSDEAPAGQHGMFGQSEHQTASAAQGRNEPASASGASATPSAMTARTQVELIRLLRPNCAHADDLEKCGGQGSKHCHACQTAAREVAA